MSVRLCKCGARVTAENPKATKCRDCYRDAREERQRRQAARFRRDNGWRDYGTVAVPMSLDSYERPELFQ